MSGSGQGRMVSVSGIALLGVVAGMAGLGIAYVSYETGSSLAARIGLVPMARSVDRGGAGGMFGG